MGRRGGSALWLLAPVMRGSFATEAEHLTKSVHVIPRSLLFDRDDRGCWGERGAKRLERLAHRAGFEPTTPRFVVWCSIQLSYRCVQARAASADAVGRPSGAFGGNMAAAGPSCSRCGGRTQAVLKSGVISACHAWRTGPDRDRPAPSDDNLQAAKARPGSGAVRVRPRIPIQDRHDDHRQARGRHHRRAE